MASVSQTLLEELECGVCFEQKELRLLPCQHRYCLECLANLYSKGVAKFCCPECRAVYTRPAYSFPVDRLSRNLIEKLSSLSIEEPAKPKCICESAGCVKSVEAKCTECEIFLCYKCVANTRCELTGDPHRHEDIGEVLAVSMKTYEDIVRHMDEEIEVLRTELNAKEAIVMAVRCLVNEEQSDVDKIRAISEISQQTDTGVDVHLTDERIATLDYEANIDYYQDKLTDKGSEDLFTSDAPPHPLPVDYKETDRQFYALYDFQGGAGTCEMLITKGETLTLVGEDPGDGWALVMNDRGDNGYVPSSYIKPSLPPKPKIRKSP